MGIGASGIAPQAAQQHGRGRRKPRIPRPVLRPPADVGPQHYHGRKGKGKGQRQRAKGKGRRIDPAPKMQCIDFDPTLKMQCIDFDPTPKCNISILAPPLDPTPNFSSMFGVTPKRTQTVRKDTKRRQTLIHNKQFSSQLRTKINKEVLHIVKSACGATFIRKHRHE